MKRVDYTNFATDYICKSDEEKITENIDDGSILLEVDTCKRYIFYLGEWWEWKS